MKHKFWLAVAYIGLASIIILAGAGFIKSSIDESKSWQPPSRVIDTVLVTPTPSPSPTPHHGILTDAKVRAFCKRHGGLWNPAAPVQDGTNESMHESADGTPVLQVYCSDGASATGVPAIPSPVPDIDAALRNHQ